MSAIATAASLAPDASDAVQSCLSDIEERLGGKPDYLMVHANAAYDMEALRLEIMLLAPDVTLHGATSCLGSMTESLIAIHCTQGIAMLGISDPRGDFGTASAAFDDAPALAAANAIQQALRHADRIGEIPQLVWVSSCPGQEEQVLAGLQHVVGETVPIVGGSAADNAIQGDWRVFSQNGIEANGLVVSVLFSSFTIGSAFHNGYAPTGESATVTAADGRIAKELDGKPAIETYRQWAKTDFETSETEPVNVLSKTTLAPLGRVCGTLAGTKIYVLSHPETILPDGSISLFTDIAVGDKVEAMQGSIDSLIRRPVHVCDSAMEVGDLSPRRISGGIIVYCAGCMLTVQDQMSDVQARLTDVLPNVPFITAFTFGEQGPALEDTNRHGNLMISAVLFGEDYA